MKTLADLQPGQTGVIESVQGEDGVAIRLMEMGLTDGESVKLVGFAPMGDPIEFSVRGYRVSLRKSEASRVHLLPSSPAGPRNG